MNPEHPLRVAVLVKQVPRPNALQLDADGRLDRSGVELEMNAFCRRAVTAGIDAAQAFQGHCTVMTMGPVSAEDCLREAIACGADRGVLLTDPAFAGSDTLATARTLAAALRYLGPFDLVLAGRNSVDADTAQMPAQLAELLDLPMAAGVRELTLSENGIEAYCDHDDGILDVVLPYPALLTCAERLNAPGKAGPDQRAAVPADRITRLGSADLGSGPWGAEASPTQVGQVREHGGSKRLGLRYHDAGPQQLHEAVAVLAANGAFEPRSGPVGGTSDANRGVPPRGTIAILAEPGRAAITRELVAAAAGLAGPGCRVAVVSEDVDAPAAGSWGADLLVPVSGGHAEEDLASALSKWCLREAPYAMLAPSTMWGREVAARVAARLGAGLVGDAVGLEVGENGLVCWKPAFSGTLVAAITCRTAIQLVTVRPGALAPPAAVPRWARLAAPLAIAPRGRLNITGRRRHDDADDLAGAHTVVALGSGVAPEDYPDVREFAALLGASLAATRKVTDRGWQPRSRQIGITGRSVAPRLFITIGASGNFNHLAGAQAADLILAINSDPHAPAFEAADVGLVGDWRSVLPGLTDAILSHCGGAPAIVRQGSSIGGQR